MNYIDHRSFEIPPVSKFMPEILPQVRRSSQSKAPLASYKYNQEGQILQGHHPMKSSPSRIRFKRWHDGKGNADTITPVQTRLQKGRDSAVKRNYISVGAETILVLRDCGVSTSGHK
jgi:hypothetical protein